MRLLRRAVLLVIYGSLCAVDFLVQWAKLRCGEALKEPAPPT